MYVNLRLTEYFWYKYETKNLKIFLLLAQYFRALNAKNYQFEHGYQHEISTNVTFHHTDLTFPDHTSIGEGTHLYKNVTLAKFQGHSPNIGKNNLIFSHAIILGKKTSDNVVVGAGAVVIDNVDKACVIAGVPARIVRANITDISEYLE